MTKGRILGFRTRAEGRPWDQSEDEWSLSRLNWNALTAMMYTLLLGCVAAAILAWFWVK